MTAALRKHWPEYLMEAAGLGAFMISACTFAVLLEHPASPLRAALPNATARRGCMGLAMGLTAAAIVYSPWGRQSGAHLNPSVTLAFLTLRRIPRVDAAFYAGAQVVGGALGVLAAWALLGARLSHPAAHFALTAPGPGGALLAFGAEAAISFVLMTVVLHVSGSRHARLTGICAAALVAVYILVEAPISGMSMNPARSLASALAARRFGSLWIYFTAPPLGMLLAAILYARRGQQGCAKLVHASDSRCIFCEERAARPAGGRA